MSNREFVQLSHTLKSQSVGGWYESSKLDGFRVIWDGGVSRGIPKANVPWANHDKDERYKVAPIATGLWSRYGNVVHAPEWFLDSLPVGVVLDGECFNETLSRQQVRSICARLEPDDRWTYIQFQVFNRLSPEVWLGEGRINNPNFKEKILTADHYGWYLEQGGKAFDQYPFHLIYTHLQNQTYWSDMLRLVTQTKMPSSPTEYISQRLVQEMAKPHGEGLILTNPHDFAVMKRTNNSLKVKPRDDSEGVVVGYITGREGKLRGMLGALILDWQGKRLELSGFTDAERHLTHGDWAYNNPECELLEDMSCPRFPRGSQVTFTYRGVSDTGVPQEAVFDRRGG